MAKLQAIPQRVLDSDPDDVELYCAYNATFRNATIRRLTREEPDFLN